ncbi:MAG: class I SAM-dependent methyltransferase [Ignavibacteriaceae bacterium]
MKKPEGSIIGIPNIIIFFEIPMELFLYRRWRKRLFRQIKEGKVLEVGIGTGKNLPYYPFINNGIGIDLSEGMLKQARNSASKKNIVLLQADAQKLPFCDDTFNKVVATYVFCSVPDPVIGLSEIRRVLKPDGKLLMLEHVLPENNLLKKLFNKINPFVVKKSGVHINRKTGNNIKKAGFKITKEVNFFSTIFKYFEAEKNA